MKDRSPPIDNPIPPDGATPRHRWLLAIIIMALSGLAVLTLAAPRFSNNEPEPGKRQHPLTVATLQVRPETSYTVERPFIGRVEAVRQSALGFELGGKLNQVLMDEGDRVGQGQLLARLDTARLEAQRRELVAALEQARANRSLAAITLKRLIGVVKAGGVSRQGLDEAREALRVAEASVALARSRIDSLDVDLAKTELHAPFAAVVSRRLVDEGQVLSPGEPVFQVLERAPPEVRIGIAGPLVDTLQVGQHHELNIRGRRFTAHVNAVLPVRGAHTRTVDVILTLDTNPELIRPGDLATLTLTDSVAVTGYWLPIDALSEGPRGLWTVFRLEPVDGDRPSEAETPAPTQRVVPHIVEILHQDADRVFVQGIPGQKALLVASGLHRIVPGQQVRPDRDLQARFALGEKHHGRD